MRKLGHPCIAYLIAGEVEVCEGPHRPHGVFRGVGLMALANATIPVSEIWLPRSQGQWRSLRTSTSPVTSLLIKE